jgi:hypothetical protein
VFYGDFMERITTIQVAKETKKNLEFFKDCDRETFDEVINRLMEITKRVEKEVRTNRLSSALLSEKSLAKEWLSKKEEGAWKNL